MEQQYFDGVDFQPKRDDARLSNQYIRIWNVMHGAGPQTLSQVSLKTRDPEASISAQLRHMRKARFGGHTIKKVYIGNGLYTYELIPNLKNET